MNYVLIKFSDCYKKEVLDKSLVKKSLLDKYTNRGLLYKGLSCLGVCESNFMLLQNKENFSIDAAVCIRKKRSFWKKESTFWIYGVIVEEHKRGNGLGNLLMHLAIDTCRRNTKQIYLKVEISNYKAIKLYEKIGFNIVYNNQQCYVMKYEYAL